MRDSDEKRETSFFFRVGRVGERDERGGGHNFLSPSSLFLFQKSGFWCELNFSLSSFFYLALSPFEAPLCLYSYSYRYSLYFRLYSSLSFFLSFFYCVWSREDEGWKLREKRDFFCFFEGWMDGLRGGGNSGLGILEEKIRKMRWDEARRKGVYEYETEKKSRGRKKSFEKLNIKYWVLGMKDEDGDTKGEKW